ncbi:hypothetical protein ABZY04_12015, partial [Streptomyces sp. NPDC002922]
MTDDGTCLPAASLLLDEQLCFTVYAAQRAATAVEVAREPVGDGLPVPAAQHPAPLAQVVEGAGV